MDFLTEKCDGEKKRISKARIVWFTYGGSCKICHGTRNSNRWYRRFVIWTTCVRKEQEQKDFAHNPVQHPILSTTGFLPQTAESMGFDTSEFDVNNLLTFLQSLDSSRRKLLSEISTLGKLLLVMPATNAVSERSFSALKRVKTYLRSTTGDSRLNHLMMLHVHKDRTDAITLVDVANDFVGEKENRKQLFGKFSANDIPNKFSISSKSTQTEN